MKNQLSLLLLLIFLAISCSQKEESLSEKPLSEQQFEFEIYDSLVVDYLGNLTLMDQSPDGKHFLLIDQNTDSILVTDPSGKTIYSYKITGEGPEKMEGNRTGVAKFLDNSTFLIPSSRALYQYSLAGELIKSFPPDFEGMSQLVIPSSTSHTRMGDQVITLMKGRYDKLGSSGLEYQAQSRQLEIFDFQTGDFSPIVPFPKESKFSSSTLEFGLIDHYPAFTVRDDSLYLIFRNEPKLFIYSKDQWDTPASIKPIPLPKFIEREISQKDAEGFNVRDFFYGSIGGIWALENQNFLISYLSGLTNEESDEAIAAAGSDFNKIFEEGEKKNSGGYVLFNGNQVSPVIIKSEQLGNINSIYSQEEIWFSPDFEKVENDYSVIYKTRLISR
ncbi:hypothetical protein Aoki45_18410 [Algoriphagus sp. oki45]|uniref:hypothetical protein n=1 Tax=Algoriphagus sp. oki45 TaxID=3067294 RepID=UPI0027F99223|nr:hypothetical protein Aoki45_18410 [Algoriphagus sp. oki45]